MHELVFVCGWENLFIRYYYYFNLFKKLKYSWFIIQCVSFRCTAKWLSYICIYDFLVVLVVKKPPANTDVRNVGLILGWEDPLEEGMAPDSSIRAWRILWTEEPGRLQSTGLQRVRHDWMTCTHMHAYMYILFQILFPYIEILSIVCCAIQQVLIYLFYIY